MRCTLFKAGPTWLEDLLDIWLITNYTYAAKTKTNNYFWVRVRFVLRWTSWAEHVILEIIRKSNFESVCVRSVSYYCWLSWLFLEIQDFCYLRLCVSPSRNTLRVFHFLSLFLSSDLSFYCILLFKYSELKRWIFDSKWFGKLKIFFNTIQIDLGTSEVKNITIFKNILKFLISFSKWIWTTYLYSFYLFR